MIQQMIPPSLVLGFGAGLGDINMKLDKAFVQLAGGNHAYSEPHVAFQWQNRSLFNALRKIDARRSGMRLTPCEKSEDMLREARAGGMYGLDSLYLALAEQLKADGKAEVATFDEGMKKQAQASAPTVEVELLAVIKS